MALEANAITCLALSCCKAGRAGQAGVESFGAAGCCQRPIKALRLRNQGDPILNLSTPDGISKAKSATNKSSKSVRQLLNMKQLVETGDQEIATRINAYEMAFRMQSSAPELMDTTDETQETLDLYGIKSPKETTFARNCLLARRLVERGVRFIQLYHTNWDHHGGPSENLDKHLPDICEEIDQSSAGLILDLKRRGLLDDTIVVWGGEFGRTPMGEERESTGRNHHIDAFTIWMAGGGFQPGVVHGKTDELGFGPVEHPTHVRNVHATLLNQMGLDHNQLSIRFQGLDVRLTGVEEAHVINELLT